MNAPPAFQFYPDDFLGGVVSMTNEEKGMYISALCIQWNKGGVTEDEMDRLGRGMAVPSLTHVKGKFKQCSDGVFRNQRLESERRKQREYRENRKKSGELGAKSRWHSHSTAIAQPMAKNGSPSPSPSPSPIAESEPAREKEFREANGRMTLQEVKDVASMIGLAEWRAVDWFHEMEGCGWLDHQSRPIWNGKAVMARVKTKWESDGRPSGPAKGKHANDQKPRGTSPDRNAGTYNEGRAHLYKNAAIKGYGQVPSVPDAK